MKNIIKLFIYVAIITLLSCETENPKNELIYNELTQAQTTLTSINLVDNGMTIFYEPTVITICSYIEMNLHSNYIMFVKYYVVKNMWNVHKYTVFYEDISHYSINKNCLTILL